MSEHVDESVRQQGWPPDQFHPAYASFTDWLDAEAPVRQELKRRNRRTFARRAVTRRTSR